MLKNIKTCLERLANIAFILKKVQSDFHIIQRMKS